MRHALIAALACAASTNAGEDAERGVEFGASAVVELLHSTQAGNWPARLELSASIELDLGALTGWSPLDNVYALALPTLAWGEEEDWRWRARLYVAWLKWDGSEKWNLLAGLYDPTWDFHSLPSAAPFVRLPSRLGGEFFPGSPGLLDLYPLAAPAVRIEFKTTRHLTFQTAALALDDEYEMRGRPALPDGGSGSRPLFLAELAWRTTDGEAEHRGRFHTGVGGWLLTGQTSWGVYAFADATLWREPGGADQGCLAFASASFAAARDRTADRRFAGGLTWRGLLPHRADDITAAAIIHERRTDEEETRTAWELLHRIPLTDGSWLQFTMQRQARDDWRLGVTLGWEL